MNCRLLSYNEIEIVTKSPAETEQLGFLLGKRVCTEVALLLQGELGMGKTLLTQGIASALDIQKIKSPSFTLVSEHSGRVPLAHADLYRLDRAEAVDELDLESYIDDGFLLVVEWSERWLTAPKDEIVEINFERDDAGPQIRTIKIKATGCRAEEMVRSLSREIGSDGKCLYSE